MIILRDYQKEVFQKIYSLILEGVKSILVVMPCRSGKTPVAAFIADRIYRNGGRVYFNVHRKILIDQSSKFFNKVNIPHGIISPLYPSTENKVQVTSIGTLYRRLEKMPIPDVILSDEAHRDKSYTREKILTKYKDSVRIGFTATPKRLSGEPLGDIYQEMVLGPTPRYLIDKGFLCDYTLYVPPTKLDIQGISKTGGDYARDELSKRSNTIEIIGDAIKHYKRLANNLQTCVFCVDINHALKVAEEYRQSGISAACINSNMSKKDQDYIINSFVNKDIKIITNVDMITEGYDCPGIDVVQLLRKTMSVALHIQMSTRGMTPAIGKEKCIILDHVENSHEHGTVDSDFQWSLDGKIKEKSLDDMEVSVKIKVCGRCWHAYKPYLSECPECGWTSTKEPVNFKIIDKELIEFKLINKNIKMLVGDNNIKGVPIGKLKERLDLFKENDIPENHEAFIKIQKRYDVLKAKNASEIIEVAVKYGYGINWAANRYMVLNRKLSNYQAYREIGITCVSKGISLGQ